MQVRSTTDIDRFRAEVGPWLLRKPVENNVLLYHTYDPSGDLPGDAPAHPRWVVDPAGAVVGAAWVHAPYRPTITDMPAEAAAALAEDLAKQEPWIPGVNGPAEAAEAFATRWADLTGKTANRERDQWLMVCTNANRIDQTTGTPASAAPTRWTRWPAGSPTPCGTAAWPPTTSSATPTTWWPTRSRAPG